MTADNAIYWPYLYWQIGAQALVLSGCPSIGLVTRPAIRHPSTCYTALKGNKVPYAHMSGTFTLPEWLGSKARIESVSGYGRGDMKAKYRRSGGDVLGSFEHASKVIQSPSTSSMSLVAKESVCEALYGWSRPRNMDIRTQSCGRTDDPNNWDAIKRLCSCYVTKMDTGGETSMEPGDEGETLVKVNMESPYKPIIIHPVNYKQLFLYDEARFAEYTTAPVVTGWGDNCGYLVPASDGAVYPMYMAAYGDNPASLTSGSALLPYPVVDVDAHDNIVVAVLSDGSVYWSDDSGKTFYASTGVTGALVVSIYSYSNILVGCSGGIYSDGELFQSTDGGRTFLAVDPYDAVTGDAVAICYLDNKTVYVLDSTGMVSVSDDGGETFIQTTAVTSVDNPTSMVLVDGALMVGGYASQVPVVAGSEDGGYTWYLLVRFPGTSAVNVGVTPKVLLTSCGCGVVVASVLRGSTSYVVSEVYRNVNWGATGCWELIWDDSVQTAAYNGLWVVTDIACSCTNSIMAVGQVAGDDPLYFGLLFSSALTRGEDQ